jgi:hypothetical protein
LGVGGNFLKMGLLCSGALQERSRKRQKAQREDKRRARKERIREQLSYGFCE